MFDALVVCEAKLTYHMADGSTREDALPETQRLPHRSRCDPTIFFPGPCRRCADPGGRYRADPAQLLPGENTMAFWYHFAILFEALFILTAVDAGTRAGRFMLQDLLGSFVPALKRTESWTANLIATAGCVAMWGYLLYQGVIDPLGGINTLWPLFGISNQMLAGIALMLATVVLIKMKRQRYVWVTMLPAVWLLICTTTAGFIKLFDANPAIGFLALAKKYSDALANGQILAPAKNIEQMQHVIYNAYTNATLTALFLFVVFSILFYALKVGIAAWGTKERTDKEAPFQALPDA